MAKTTRITFRSFLPGAGQSLGGKPKQGKTNVRGRMEVVYSFHGESLTPADLGLSTIDTLELSFEDIVGGVTDLAAGWQLIGYNKSTDDFYIVKNLAGAPQELADGSAINVYFNAFGDSSHDVELT